jgi:hypothetical protein
VREMRLAIRGRRKVLWALRQHVVRYGDGREHGPAVSSATHHSEPKSEPSHPTSTEQQHSLHALRRRSTCGHKVLWEMRRITRRRTNRLVGGAATG